MNLFGLFSVGLGLSVTTGYSWKNTSNEVMNEETRTVLTAVVKPGQKVIIEQAVGYCDSKLVLYLFQLLRLLDMYVHSTSFAIFFFFSENVVKTDYYRFRELDKLGRVIKEEYQWHLKNDTFKTGNIETN